MPSDWPLQLMSSFLAKSLQQVLYHQHQYKILNKINAKQNLAVKFYIYMPNFICFIDVFFQKVKEYTWLMLQAQGMVIEEIANEHDLKEEKCGFEEDVVFNCSNQQSWVDFL